MKWLEQNHVLAGIISLFVAATAYAYTTFATMTYVDAKHQDVKEVLAEIKMDLKEVKSMQFELFKRGK